MLTARLVPMLKLVTDFGDGLQPGAGGRTGPGAEGRGPRTGGRGPGRRAGPGADRFATSLFRETVEFDVATSLFREFGMEATQMESLGRRRR